MKERRGRLSRFVSGEYKAFGRPLSSTGKSRVLPGRPFFALAFRHDLDGMEQGDLDKFIDLHQAWTGGSTDFVLPGQFKRWRSNSARLLALDHEIALHSEARPRLMLGNPQATRILEGQYRRRLVNQIFKAEHYSGLPLAGHAPHDVNNYLPFDASTTWEIIGQATLKTGLAYVADYEGASRTPSGTDRFPLPSPPYLRVRGEHRVVVLPVGWDDKFFWASWADRNLKGWGRDFLDRTLDEAWASLESQLEACREKRRPLVVNLHPYWFVRGALPTWELKQRALEWAAREGVAVLKHMDMAARAAGI
ncbi:MAG: hypothetical protein JRJ59_11315 [Deltaproteobacteria bacterium]|nr:hypothetical protein [Deltaproteobacteria bacterium]